MTGSQFYFVPGWGYSAVWWKKACSMPGSLVSWGYCEEPVMPMPSVPFCLVVHSFGLYLLPQALLEQAKAVIWYGGFFTKLPLADATYVAYKKNPAVVEASFVDNMYFPLKELPIDKRAFLCSCKRERMLHDLERLVSFSYEAFWHTHSFLYPKLHCAFGDKDRIVTHWRLQESTCVKRSCSSIIVANEGHMPTSERFFHVLCKYQQSGKIK